MQFIFNVDTQVLETNQIVHLFEDFGFPENCKIMERGGFALNIPNERI